MIDTKHERSDLSGRDQFLTALGACEQTSAALLSALESGTSDPAALANRRLEQIEWLTSNLPGELCVGDLERLKLVLNVGQEVWLKALAEKLSATRTLASLQRALQVARQLAATRAPRQSGIDCTG
jgi:hypothetical protein